MGYFSKICGLAALFFGFSLLGLEEGDRSAIRAVIKGYTHAWNQNGGKGFSNGFTEDADFVNIFGMHFKGKAEIEDRHLQILQNLMKGSSLKILDIRVREAKPGVAIALVHWSLDGYRNPFCEKPSEVREGLFTHVFIKEADAWKITASQNTRMPKDKSFALSD
jgi:uncharacterized protein (TIGR02246 family)